MVVKQVQGLVVLIPDVSCELDASVYYIRKAVGVATKWETSLARILVSIMKREENQYGPMEKQLAAVYLASQQSERLTTHQRMNFPACWVDGFWTKGGFRFISG